MKPRNFFASFVEVTAGTADTDFTFSHGLSAYGRGVIPQGFIVVGQNGAGNLYIGTVAWTTTQATLKSSVGSIKYRVIFFA